MEARQDNPPKWKGVQRSGKRVRDTPALTVRSCSHLNVIGSHKIKGSGHIKRRCDLIEVYVSLCGWALMSPTLNYTVIFHFLIPEDRDVEQ